MVFFLQENDWKILYVNKLNQKNESVFYETVKVWFCYSLIINLMCVTITYHLAHLRYKMFKSKIKNHNELRFKFFMMV